ncbi:gliding motility-associated C-terminal domain-containing protein [Tunicatimonas pelagia]|uniref:T9SS type B sorting domain-containing protein n=1 Tax=Tunicatimonas pelagia TaxID=931531 RepID=UPI0026671161|nr:gliding motility-associated C-terminal domain-containing protein [Tunicatimonas pelagia]WKN43842.1 gliding motility-associated C-terminal domain-containing protein [Tunicatimonas pelagia]
MKLQSIWLSVLLMLALSFSVVAQEVNCANGIDDDGDGLADCFDDDCVSSPLCQNRESDCTDGLDNDGDGLPDCLDDDCKGTPNCPVETNCNNGIDDDGDGFFDYYDGDCLADPDNPNDFIINVADCEVRPSGNLFTIEKAWDSPMQTSATRGSFALADLDKDGIAEVISYNDETGYMYILEGKDGSIKDQVKVTDNEEFASYPAVGDVDGDGFGEIFHIDRSGRVRAYNHNLTSLWSTQSAPASRPRPPLLADFNQDGVAELYYVNEIRDATTGTVLVEGSHGKNIYPSGNDWNNNLAGVPVAVDILPQSGSCPDCDGLELAIGHLVYSVNLVSNQLTERLNMDDAATKIGHYHTDGYRPKQIGSGEQNWSSTSVADFNQDGHLDIICSGTTGSLEGPTTIFFWDIHNNTVRSFIPTRPVSTIPAGFTDGYGDFMGTKFWKKGVGALNIANIDNDAGLECTFMSGSSLYALDENWNLKWANYTDYWEGSSGFTSTAVFDFDGDGASEIIYRDEINLHIVDGFTGDPVTLYASADFCSSNTHAEYPIVADVDGDGETEIVVVCGRDQNFPNETTRTGGGNQKFGFIRAYKAAPGTFWVPSRSVWNQFAYFNVNINDDLSIPRYQQQHHLGFAQECNLLPTGTAGFSLNKYLNQSPKINFCGILQFPSPKLDFTAPPEVFPPTCPDTRFRVRLRFINSGDDVVGNPVPISFYQNDPQVAYSNGVASPYLETIEVDIPGGLQPGESLDTLLWVNGISGPFTLYTSLNDIGPFNQTTGSSLSNTAFYPLDELNGTIRECDTDPDVVATPVTPFPFNVTALVVQDNSKCAGAFNSDGIVTANVGGDTVNFIFRWYQGNVVKTVPDYLGATQTGLTGGTYLVVAEAPGANCNSSSRTVVVDDLAVPPVVVTSITDDQVSCDPANPTGALSAYVDEGGTAVTAGYSFFWYRGLNDVIPARPGYSGGPTVDQLPSGDYRLVVSNANTGCTTVEDVFLPDNQITPPIRLDDQVDVTVCDPAFANGEAEVSVSGNTTDYDFYWYSGNVSSPDTTSAVLFQGNHLEDQMSGTFTVFAADRTTRCLSDPLVVTINDNSVNPVVNTEVVAPQSACAPVPPNGSLRATVDESATGGSATETSGYTFEWYAGNQTSSTLPATPLSTGSVLSGADRGNYTVVVTNTTTGCQTFQYRFLPQQITRPVIDLNATVVHADNCTDPWGSSITVSADGGQTSADGYTFEWRDASNTVLPETSETLNNIPPGIYTVLVASPLGCTAQDTAQYEILDQAPKPTISLRRFNNNSCDAGQPNGVIAANSFSGLATDYSFAWFSGSPSGSQIFTNISANGDSIFNLAAGTYALRITDNTTQCSSVAYTSIQDVPTPQPLIDTVSVTATTDCRAASADGEVIFAVIGGSQPLPYDVTTNRTYTFRLYAGTTATGVPMATTSSGQFSGLNFGDYTATVEDDFTRCVSPPMTISIEQDPDIQLTWGSFIPPASCSTADGSLGISATSPSNNSPSGAGYTFDWYFLGNSKNNSGLVNPGVIFFQNDFESRRETLSSGYYAVTVTDNLTGCEISDTLFLPQADPPSLSTSVTDATECSPGNGSIEFTITPGGSPLTPLDRYRVYLYIGNSFDLGNEIDTLNPVGTVAITSNFTDYAPGQYTVGIVDNISGCPIIEEAVRIRMINPDPIITFFPSADFSCDTDGEGQLIASVVGGGDGDANQGNFTFEWFEGVDTSTPLPAAQVDDSLAFDLPEGYYTVRITDNDGVGQGCSYDSTYYLPKLYKDIAITSITTLPDSVCGPSPTGNIWVNTITEDGTSVALSDYTLELLDDTFTSFAATGTGIASDPFTALPEGDYYVRATNLATDCETVSSLILVENTAEPPGITITEEEPDFSCAMGSSTNGTGILNATATGTFDNDADQDHFTYTWFAGNDTLSVNQLPAANIDTDPSRAIGLTAGQYTVLVQDTSGHSNQCTYFITYEVTSVDREVILTLDTDPQQICDPADGTAFVVDTQEEYYFNGTQVIDTDVSDYTYNLYDNELDSLTTSATGQFEYLAEGIYFITTDSVNNCYSAPTSVEVDNISEDPIISIQLIASQYSRNPDPSSWTGALQAQVQVANNQPLDSIANNFTYRYRWYNADDYNVGQEIGTDAAINQLDSGEYLIEVLNEVTGCVTTNRFLLPFVEVEPQLFVQANPQTVCFANGSLALDSITLAGEVDRTEDYQIKLYANVYDPTQAALDSVVNFSGTVPFDSLLAGTYYVRGFHQTLQLETNLLQLDIRDESTVPRLDIEDLQAQRSCDTLRLATGAIAIKAIEADGSYAPYTYRWFRGATTNPMNELVLETEPTIDSLTAGLYTVLVENQRTRCAAIQNFQIVEQTEIPEITATAAPASVCDPQLGDGMVQAEPLSSGRYRYDWYIGDTIQASPDFVGQVWAGVMPGNYTVTATDITTNTCTSLPITVTVEDQSVPPQVEVMLEEPYSTCDPNLPNGLLYAQVNGQTVGYDYRWYDTQDNLVSEGPRAYNLTPQTYRVEVTERATGCVAEAVGIVEQGERIVDAPDVEILSHMTNCADPDGAVTVSVNGGVEDYAFSFYYADGTPLPDSLISVGEADLLIYVSSLPADTYQVTVTELITACTSEAAFFEILDEGYTPPFRVETTPSSCGASNGTATVIPEEGLRVVSVEWGTPETNGFTSQGYVTKNLPAGTLPVQINWENGCSYEGMVEIGTDINVYNAVTPNGDGDHDFFEIDCIDLFPNNTVKIFNRAGSSVYEAQYYNNQNVRFEGIGNRGLYVGGQRLPDGTYFYVIEKNDGSKPKTGYLELIN